MLLLQSDLKNFTLHASDGEIGRSRDFLFDDARWVIRYMEANTGRWLGRHVLISPISIGEPDLEAKQIPVKLTKREIEAAPGAESDEPISEQFEREYYGYFGYPYYWVGGDVWGLHGYPADLLQQSAAYRQGRPAAADEEKIRESHLRSMHEVAGYTIHAMDDEIGHVADFVLESSNWAVRYLVVDIRRWLPGPSVLISPQWINRVSWHDKQVFVDIDKKAIETAPKFTPPISRDDELAVFKHFGRQPYWGESRSRAAGNSKPPGEHRAGPD